MVKRRAGTIPDETWEKHKGDIVSLYQSSTLESVMQLMSERHGFHASKNQYTRMFKKWNIRRYSNVRDWRKVDKCIRQRRSKGKASNVILYGNLISRGKLEKEIARNVSFTDKIFDAQGDDDNVSLPDGVTILTPPAATVLPPRNRLIRTDNLPWFLFNQEVRSQIILRKALSDPTRLMDEWDLDNLPHLIHDSSLFSLETYLTHQDLLPSSIFTTTSGLENTSFDLGRIFAQLRNIQSSWVEASPSSLIFDPGNPTLTMLLQKATVGYFGTSLESIYKTYMVEDNRIGSYTERNLNTRSNSMVYQLLSLFIFMVTNNLLRTDCVRDIYACANSYFCSWIFTDILKLKSTTTDIFAIKILPAAVQAGDVDMVRDLVSRNEFIDFPLEIARDHQGGKHSRTALSIAIGERNVRMINVLLELGATPTVLEMDSIAVKETRASLWSPENIEILSLLLFHGANPECLISDKPRGYPLIKAAFEGSLEAVSLLLAAGAGINLSIRELRGTALQASTVGGHIQVVRALLAAKADVNIVHIPNESYDFRIHFDGNYGLYQTPIQIATKANNTEVALLLLRSGALVNYCPILTYTNPQWIDIFFNDAWRMSDEALPFAFAIQYAAQHEHIPLVHQLLLVGAMVDSRIGNEYGDTPLQIAVKLGNVELVSLLLAHNADVNAPPGKYDGRTAIQAAAESGNIRIIQILLNAGADVHASPGWSSGRTALQVAVEKGHINAARRLLLAGADINANPGFRKGLTALQAAVSFGDVEIVKELLDYGADVNAAAGPVMGLTVLQVAVMNKNITMLNFLLQIGADVNALPSEIYNKTALQCAVDKNWMEGVRLLLSYNVDVRMLPPYYGYWALSALGRSIDNDNHDMMVLLLDHGASPNDPAMKSRDEAPTAFLYALRRSASYETIRLFVERGADISQCCKFRPALEWAVKVYKDVDEVRMIIDLMSKTTTENHFDNSFQRSLAFWTPSREKLPANIELLQLLLDKGANINAEHPDGKTTILQRSSSVSVEVVEFLLQNGAEVNAPAAEEIGTPLQEAIITKQTKIADLLLEYGADVNAPKANWQGVTALQAAAIHGYMSLAMKLLEHGADVTAAGWKGRTAIDLAAEHGHLDMLQLLLNAYGDREGLASVCDQAASFAEEEGHVAIAVWLRGYAAS